MADKTRFLLALDLFGGLTALLLVLTWLYGLQVRNWYRARELGAEHPAVSLVPQPLANTIVAHNQGLTLTEFGYEFDVPQTKIETRRATSRIAAYVFSGGRALSFWNPAEITTTVETVRNTFERSNRPFVDFLGAHTEYDLLKSELSVTPGQISPFMAKADAYRRGLLLSFKLSDLRSSPSKMYSFELGGRRGFELGDPGSDRIVDVRSFDANDREFRFLFAVENQSNAKLDQSEINEIIQSLRRAGKRGGESGAPSR